MSMIHNLPACSTIALMNAVIVNRAAVEVGALAQDTVGRYFTHVAAMQVARDERAEGLAPPVEAGQNVPVLRIPRRDGNHMIFWFNHYLRGNRDPAVAEEFDRTYLRGALLTVADALGDNGYFGHCPEAEMVRHLRNGIGHKNRFTFHSRVIDPATGRLRHPANTFGQAAQQNAPRHEIDTHMQGTEVLWTWGGPDAIVDTLIALSLHLLQIGYGPVAPLNLQTLHAHDVQAGQQP